MKQSTRVGVGIVWVSVVSSLGCGGVDSPGLGDDAVGDDGSVVPDASSDVGLPGVDAAMGDAGLPGLDGATGDASLSAVVRTGCQALCAAETDAGCSAPTTLSECLVGCAVLAGNPSCATQTSAFFSCTAGAAVSCDSSGNPSFPDCDIAYLTAEACVLANATSPTLAAPCTQYCANVASANCPNDADGGCVGGCEAAGILVASCSSSWSAYLTCSATAPMTCGSDGKASASACLVQDLGFIACVSQNLSTLLGDGG